MPLEFGIKFPNLERRMRELGGIPRSAIPRLGRVLGITMLEILRDTKTKTPSVPIATGALRSSGHVDPPRIRGGKIVAGIGYGGVPGPAFRQSQTNKRGQTRKGKPIIDYAVVVHEDLSTPRLKPRTAGAKFVSTHIARKNKRGHIDRSLIRELNKVIKESMT